MCGVLQTADSKELFIILPQTSHRFQSNEAPVFKVNIHIFEHKVKPFCAWIQCLGFIWHLLVTSSPCSNGIFTKGVLSLQNCLNLRESANHPGKKITRDVPITKFEPVPIPILNFKAKPIPILNQYRYLDFSVLKFIYTLFYSKGDTSRTGHS